MHTLKSIVLLICAAAAAAATFAATPRAPASLAIDGKPVKPSLIALLFQDGFETALPTVDSDRSHPFYRRVSNGDGITELSSTHRREGLYGLRVQLAKNGTRNFRQELRIKSVTDKRMSADSLDYWYGDSVYVPAGSSLQSDSVMTQWHTHNPNSGHSPLVGLRIRNGNWYVTRECTGTVSDLIGPVKTNEWTDWVYQIRWRTDATGLIRIWQNGTLVFERENVQTAWEGEPEQPYVLVGRYTSSWKLASNSDSGGVSQESWHDSSRICQAAGCGYQDVAPRGDRLQAP